MQELFRFNELGSSPDKTRAIISLSRCSYSRSDLKSILYLFNDRVLISEEELNLSELALRAIDGDNQALAAFADSILTKNNKCHC